MLTTKRVTWILWKMCNDFKLSCECNEENVGKKFVEHLINVSECLGWGTGYCDGTRLGENEEHDRWKWVKIVKAVCRVCRWEGVRMSWFGKLKILIVVDVLVITDKWLE